MPSSKNNKHVILKKKLNLVSKFFELKQFFYKLSNIRASLGVPKKYSQETSFPTFPKHIVTQKRITTPMVPKNLIVKFFSEPEEQDQQQVAAAVIIPEHGQLGVSCGRRAPAKHGVAEAGGLRLGRGLRSSGKWGMANSGPEGLSVAEKGRNHSLVGASRICRDPQGSRMLPEVAGPHAPVARTSAPRRRRDGNGSPG